MFSWGIRSITFSGGEVIPLELDSMLILVGPNSSGKSTALRDLERQFQASSNLQVIKYIERACNGDIEDFRAWLESHYSSYERDGVKYYRNIESGSVGPRPEELTPLPDEMVQSVFEHNCNAEFQHLKYAHFFLYRRLDVESRLAIGNPTKSVNYATGNAKNYIHILQLREDLRRETSNEVHMAFRKELEINWGGGPDVWFHVGDIPERTLGTERIDPNYLDLLNQVPRLENEGDGIRSFIGIVLAAVCGGARLLIDEPEAFLHPSQSVRLGRLLAGKAREQNRQIIVATHSSAFVRGAISGSSNVTICRLTRDGSVNHAHVLTRAQLNELWSKPLLRSASAVEGIFYAGVVVCEADGDARFYEALLHRLERENKTTTPADLYFVSGAGKGELAPLAEAYKSLNVPVAVVADFDLLRKQGEFTAVLTSLGRGLSEVKSLYDRVISTLNALPSSSSIPDFLTGSREIINRVEQRGNLTGKDRKEFSDLMATSASWSEAKKYGIFLRWVLGVNMIKWTLTVAFDELMKED